MTLHIVTNCVWIKNKFSNLLHWFGQLGGLNSTVAPNKTPLSVCASCPTYKLFWCIRLDAT